MKCAVKGFGPLAALGVLLVAAPAAVQAQDDARIQQLEKAVQELNREIQSLKEQAADQKEKAAADQQRVAEQVPAVRISDGIAIEDPRGIWSLRFTGRIQGDYRTYDPDGSTASTFGVRRARLGAGLTMYRDYQMYVEGEFINGAATGTTTQSAALTNGWLDLGWFQAARVRMGQFKPQFGFENSMPDVLTDFQERALTQSLLQNLNYDRGIMVHGAPFIGTYYGVTLSNGAGLNLEESQGSAAEASTDGKDITVRAAANFGEIFERPDAVLHVGGNYKTGTVVSRGGTTFTPATVQTEARGITFFNSTALGAAGARIDRTLVVAEFVAAKGPIKLQTEWWQARYEGAEPVTYRRKLKAYYATLGWLITREAWADAYRNGVFGRVRPRNNFSTESGGGWGAWEALLRYSSFDGTDFASSNPAGTGVPAAGSTNEADAITASLKWMPNPYVRLLVNYVRTDFATPVTVNALTTDYEKALTFRAQFDF